MPPEMLHKFKNTVYESRQWNTVQERWGWRLSAVKESSLGGGGVQPGEVGTEGIESLSENVNLRLQ